MFFLIQISSLILFIGILKFVKLLRFNNRFAVLILTLKTAWEDLLGFFAVFFLVFFAFVQVGIFSLKNPSIPKCNKCACFLLRFLLLFNYDSSKC